MIGQSFLYLVGRVLPGLLSIIAIAIMTRALTPSQYGLYALVIAAVTMLNAIAFTWNSQAVYRSFTLFRSNPGRLFRLALVGFFGSFIVSSIVILATYLFFYTAVSAKLLIGGALLLAAYAWIELSSSLLNLQGQVIDYVMLMSLRAAVNVCLGGLVAWMTGSAAWVICAMAVGWVVIGVAPRFSSWSWRACGETFYRSELLAMLRYGLPLSLSVSLSQLISSVDRGLLGLLSGPAAVAMYAVGYDLVKFCIGAIGSSLSLAYYPRIIAAADVEGPEKARELLRDYSVFQLAVLLPATAGLACIAQPLSDVLIGESLRKGAAEVIPLLSISAMLITLKAFYADFSFQLARWTLGGAISSAMALILNTAGNMVMIPRAGIMGAASVAVFSTALGLAFSLVMGHKRGFALPGIGRDHLRVIASVGLMTFVLKLIGGGGGFIDLIIETTLGVAVYAIAIALFNPLQVRTHLGTLIGKRWRCLQK